MKRILKKNQIVITTLAIMIAVAGYLNYSGRILEEEVKSTASDDSVILLQEDELADDTYQETYTDIVSLDGEAEVSADEIDIPDGNVGEAVLASSSGGNALGSSVLASAKLNREQVRAQNKESLMDVINNTTLGDDQKQEAVHAVTELTLIAEKEAAAEMLLEAKGFEDCVVSISNGSADVVVYAEELSDAQRAQIEDIVKRKTEVAGENIVITPCQ